MADDDTLDDTPEKARRASRRDFLRAAGFTAAGLGVGGIAGGLAGVAAGQQHQAPLPGTTLQPRAEGPGFDHLVVVMFENRSFDNLLGMLHTESSVPHGQSFDGVAGKHLSNRTRDGDEVAVHAYSGPTDDVMRSPDPDPGEEYPFVNTQLFGRLDPAGNSVHDIPRLQPPYNAPPDGATPDMSGFLADYIDKFAAEHGRQPRPEEYRQIMGGFTPEMLPVFSTLAREFAVYDHWHCAVPTQTFPNRSFFHAGTSHGFVTNAFNPGVGKWLDPKLNTGTTIFNRLEAAGISWRIYYDERQLISLTGLLHAPHLEPFWKTNFRTMKTFYEDVANGTLPAYSFIEPRLTFDHNDMHPPVGPMTRTDVDGTVIEGGAISDVRAGDALLHQLYTAIRESSTASGSNALNTTLLVTFDEHGGTYDHVPPPGATAPELPQHTEMDFRFDRLGVRVPTLVISAYTPSTVINDEMHHGSLISSLTSRFKLKHLTARDEHAPTIDNAHTLTTPRSPATWPSTFPLYTPPNPESVDPTKDGDDDRPLAPPGAGLMALLIARYAPGEPVPRTYREAYEAIHAHGEGLFGT
ncbi:MAG TPA: alkaline phosphatase family protein [Pseudolysinimonas sp.]